MVLRMTWTTMVPSIEINLVRNKLLYLLRVTAGLQLARLADLPNDVLTQAREIAHSLGDESTRSLENSESSKVVRRRKVVLKVRCGTSFAKIFETSKMTCVHRELPATNNIDSSL